MNITRSLGMGTAVNVSYYVRKQAQKKSGMYPVMMRISCGSQRITIGQVGINLPDPSYMKMSKITSSCPSYDEINYLLDAETMRIRIIADRLYGKGRFSLELVKKEYLDETRVNSVPNLLEVYDKFLETKEEEYRCGKIEWCTFRKWHSSRSNLYSFLRSRKRRDISLHEVTESLFHNYESFLLADLGYHRNTASKILILFKAVMRFAMEKGFISSSPIEKCVVRKIQSNVNYLSKETLTLILRSSFTMPRLELTKDMFLFACFTGLSYIDVKELTLSDIQVTKGMNFIVKDRKKTRKASVVPLLPEAQAIIDKYSVGLEDGDPILPIYSNQKINQYLKEIAEILGITERLSYHVGRHTFATLSLTNGASLETVSKMLGHASTKNTTIYAKVTSEKILLEMEQVSKKLSHYLSQIDE